MPLEVVDFINRNEDWRSVLTVPPYHIKIREDGNYMLLEYGIESNFNLQMVRESRGLILKTTPDGSVPVCVAFYKFGNAGESYCPQIDWESAKVQEKLDGSLIKVWHDDGKWNISTSGTIDATKARVGNADLTFADLFLKAVVAEVETASVLFDALDKDNTYMFELCCPENRVVVPHMERKIYHIGTRNNKTFEELDVNIGIQKPKVYPLHSIMECKEYANTLPFHDEGFVVCDKYWNRVKIKGPTYVKAFNLLNNGVINTERIVDMIRSGNADEFLTYFPDYRGIIKTVEQQMDSLIQELSERAFELCRREIVSQKDFAMVVKDDRFSAFFFENRKSGISAKEWLLRLESWRIAKYLE